MPNAQAEGAGWLAQSMPSRSEEIAWTVTANRLPSSASLGSFFWFIKMDYRLLRLEILLDIDGKADSKIGDHTHQLSVRSFFLLLWQTHKGE